ncbi:MAG: PDDEXK nuclease domain-containing protein [Fibrobacter sp.]|nr:PDDEXK nuclease domain-containing protein [Fibrobacter sp.]
MANGIILYQNDVKILKKAILSSQYKVSKSANSELLSLYYGIGRYISTKTRTKSWGTNAIEVISEELQKQLPGLRGFSATNMKYMRLFYEIWTDSLNRQPLADDLSSESDTELMVINPFQQETKVNVQEFLGISFSHHVEIFTKTKTLEERLFYIHQAFTLQWNKYTLRNQLKAGAFSHRENMPNNFASTLSDMRHRIKAIEMFKDEYLLDFVNVEEIGERDNEDIDERIVEHSIVQNIKNFIMSFGRDFTFIGNQYRIEALGKEHFIDLLFFNRELLSLVAIELKKGDFKTSYLGQLNMYLQLLDDYVKKPNENPSIGIILCRGADRTYVEYAVRDYEKPMGVATYKTLADMPEKLRKALPDIKELEQSIESREK